MRLIEDAQDDRIRGISVEITCLPGVPGRLTPQGLTLGRRSLISRTAVQEAASDAGTSYFCWASQRAAAKKSHLTLFTSEEVSHQKLFMDVWRMYGNILYTSRIDC